MFSTLCLYEIIYSNGISMNPPIGMNFRMTSSGKRRVSASGALRTTASSI